MEVVSNTLINAVETSIYYWCRLVLPSFEDKSDLPYYANCFDDNWKIEVCLYEEYNEDDSVFLDIESIKKGLQIMSDNYPKHYSDMITEEGDAVTADVFFQCMTFGEIVYG